MGRTLYATILLCFLFFSQSRAQTGSIILRDGSNTQISTHASIQAAYNAIPATVTQSYAIELTSTYGGTSEVPPITLTQKGGTSATNRITIRLATGAAASSISAPTNSAPALVFDGADWVTLDGFNSGAFASQGIAVSSGAPSPAFPLIEFKNGATNNTLRFIYLTNGLSAGSGDGVLLGTTTAVFGANNNNTIQSSTFSVLRDAVSVTNTVGAPNTGNQILGNQFMEVGRSGIIATGAVGKLIADSNEFTFLPNLAQAISGISIDDFRDTLRITRNRILFPRYAAQASLTGVRTRAAAGSNGGYVLLANNAVSTAITVFDLAPPADLYGFDSVRVITGIEVEGSGNITAYVLHNTVLLRGLQTGSSLVVEPSAALRIAGNTPSSSYTVQANLLLNERNGGGSGTRHPAMVLAQLVGSTSINYNVYRSFAGPLITVGNVPYTTLANYLVVAAPGNDVNSNIIAVPFDGPTLNTDPGFMDVRLGADAFNNTAFTAPLNTLVPRDIEGELRTAAYRGADELVITCNTAPPGGIAEVLQATPICEAGNVYLRYTPTNLRGGSSRQWQSRPLGSAGVWTSIPGATQTLHFQNVTAPTEFRMRDSCLAGGPAVVSAPDTAFVTYFPQLTGISLVDNGLQQTFTANLLNPTTATWNWTFGDGQSSTMGPTVSHTYAAQGVYVATVIAANDCGRDTTNLVFVVGLFPNSVPAVAGAEDLVLHPNPARESFAIQGGTGLQSAELLDMAGRIVAVYDLRRSGPAVLSLPTRLAPGMYAVRVRGGDGRVVVRPLVVR